MSFPGTYLIQSALDAQLQTVAGLPTLYVENTLATQNNINAYCRSTLGPAKSTLSSIGTSPIMKQQGLYQVDLFYPVDYGYKCARQMADSVIAAFPPGQIELSDNVNFLIVTSAWSQTGAAFAGEDSFWQIPVRVEWFIEATV